MKKGTINKTFFFFLLCLTIVLFTIPTAVTATDFYITEDEVQTSGGMRFSANSKIPIDGTYHMDTFTAQALYAIGKRPTMVRIYLKDPMGNIKYVLNIDGGQEGVDYGFTDTDFIMVLKDVDLKVPAFASMGAWRVEINWYHTIWGPLENGFAKASSNVIVGESGIMDNLMAPIYIYIDAIPIMSSDDIGIALPGIFFLSMLIWIPAVSIFLLMYVKSSYKIGMHLFKRQIGGTKNVKKINK